MARQPLPRERIVLVENLSGTRERMVKLGMGRLGRFVSGDDVPAEAVAQRRSWWRIRMLPGRRVEFIERVEEPRHVQAPSRAPAAPLPPPVISGAGKAVWAGVTFARVGLRDAGMFRGWAGLWGLARREIGGGLTLLAVEVADDLGNEARPGSAIWRVAAEADADELHVAVVRGERVDRLGLKARIVRALRPVLNDNIQAERTGADQPAQRLRPKAR